MRRGADVSCATMRPVEGNSKRALWGVPAASPLRRTPQLRWLTCSLTDRCWMAADIRRPRGRFLLLGIRVVGQIPGRCNGCALPEVSRLGWSPAQNRRATPSPETKSETLRAWAKPARPCAVRGEAMSEGARCRAASKPWTCEVAGHDAVMNNPIALAHWPRHRSVPGSQRLGAAV